MPTYTDVNNVFDSIAAGTNGGSDINITQTGGDDNTFNFDGLTEHTAVGSTDPLWSSSAAETLSYDFDRTVNGIQWLSARDNAGEEYVIYVNGTKIDASEVAISPSNGWFVNGNGNLESTGDQAGPSFADVHTFTLEPSGGIDSFSIEAVKALGAGISFDLFVDTDPYIPNITCFCKDTMIETDQGQIAVQDLEVGAMVRTKDNGYRPIRWVGKRHLTGLQNTPQLAPVRITAGALGNHLPKTDLLVSRQHRMVVNSKITERMFGVSEVLVPAIKLTEMNGVFTDTEQSEVTYYHFLLDEHQVVIANGAPSESLYTGEQAMKAIPVESREEIYEIFPELRERAGEQTLVRFVPPGNKQKRLIERHMQNGMSLVL